MNAAEILFSHVGPDTDYLLYVADFDSSHGIKKIAELVAFWFSGRTLII
jgi:hypothetical protein